MADLRDEILGDPVRYGGKTAAEIYDLIYVVRDRTKTVERSPYRIADLIGMDSLAKWNNATDPQVKLGWTLFLAALQAGQPIDMAGGPIYKEVLKNARQATPAIITADERNAVVALCTKPATRAEEIELPERHIGDIERILS